MKSMTDFHTYLTSTTNTKIANFDAPITTNQKVLRFDIPMYNVLDNSNIDISINTCHGKLDIM
jgi:hypothetical protein